MQRIAYDMTFDQISALPNMERTKGFLMETRPESVEKMRKTTAAILISAYGDVAGHYLHT